MNSKCSRTAPMLVAMTFLSCSSGDVVREAAPELQMIDGIPYKVTTIHRKSTGKSISIADTVEPIAVKPGGFIPSGSRMWANRRPPEPLEGLRSFVLHKNTQFGNVSCRGFFEYDTWFDAKWQLRICPLDGDQMIDGIPCVGSSVSTWRKAGKRKTHPAAVFYEDGKLQGCIASRAFELGGHSYESWDVVRLGRDGTPER